VGADRGSLQSFANRDHELKQTTGDARRAQAEWHRLAHCHERFQGSGILFQSTDWWRRRNISGRTSSSTLLIIAFADRRTVGHSGTVVRAV
jgi:hypothetical protein